MKNNILNYTLLWLVTPDEGVQTATGVVSTLCSSENHRTQVRTQEWTLLHESVPHHTLQHDITIK